MQFLQEHLQIAGTISPDTLLEKLSDGHPHTVSVAHAVHVRWDSLLPDQPTSTSSVGETERMPKVRCLAESGDSHVYMIRNLYGAFRVCVCSSILAHGQNSWDCLKSEISFNEQTDIITTL